MVKINHSPIFKTKLFFIFSSFVIAHNVCINDVPEESKAWPFYSVLVAFIT
jgi:hypothetical protein